MIQDDPHTTALLTQILTLEEHVWEALWRGDAKADAALLHPEFLGVYPSGFAGRQAHAAQLMNGPSIEAFRLSDARILPVGPEHVMLSYRADYRRAGQAVDEAMYVSSLWQRDGESWRNLFSQDTPISERAVP